MAAVSAGTMEGARSKGASAKTGHREAAGSAHADATVSAEDRLLERPSNMSADVSAGTGDYHPSRTVLSEVTPQLAQDRVGGAGGQRGVQGESMDAAGPGSSGVGESATHSISQSVVTAAARRLQESNVAASAPTTSTAAGTGRPRRRVATRRATVTEGPTNAAGASVATSANASTPERQASATAKEAPTVFRCSYRDCGKEFERQSKLDRHMQSHGKTRSFVCPVPECGAAYKHKAHLMRHTKDVHGQRLLIMCACSEGCGQTFARQAEMEAHVRTVHEGKEAYQCDVPGCTKGFGSRQALWHHRHSAHTTKTPCPICGKNCTSQLGLKRHIATAHAGSFKCAAASCDQGFDTEEARDSHYIECHTVGEAFWCGDERCMQLGSRAIANEVILQRYKRVAMARQQEVRDLRAQLKEALECLKLQFPGRSRKQVKRAVQVLERPIRAYEIAPRVLASPVTISTIMEGSGFDLGLDMSTDAAPRAVAPSATTRPVTSAVPRAKRRRLDPDARQMPQVSYIAPVMRAGRPTGAYQIMMQLPPDAASGASASQHIETIMPQSVTNSEASAVQGDTETGVPETQPTLSQHVTDGANSSVGGSAAGRTAATTASSGTSVPTDVPKTPIRPVSAAVEEVTGISLETSPRLAGGPLTVDSDHPGGLDLQAIMSTLGSPRWQHTTAGIDSTPVQGVAQALAALIPSMGGATSATSAPAATPSGSPPRQVETAAMAASSGDAAPSTPPRRQRSQAGEGQGVTLTGSEIGWNPDSPFTLGHAPQTSAAVAALLSGTRAGSSHVSSRSMAQYLPALSAAGVPRSLMPLMMAGAAHGASLGMLQATSSPARDGQRALPGTAAAALSESRAATGSAAAALQLLEAPTNTTGAGTRGRGSPAPTPSSARTPPPREASSATVDGDS